VGHIANKATASNAEAVPVSQSRNNSAIESQPSANDSIDEVAAHSAGISEDDQTQDTLTNQEKARLHSLKAMLNASKARSKKASRKRPPKFSAGLVIKVLSGDHVGKVGVVLDADYIANRALISLSDEESPHWIAFQLLGYAE